MKQEKETIRHWIETINKEGKNLSSWEEEFMESLTEKFENRGWISEKQEEVLERIYSEKTPL